MPSRHAVPLTPSVFHHLSQLPRCEQNEQSNFHSPYTLPSSVSCKSSACHSYENTGGVGVFFPFWNSLVGCRGFDPGNECLSKSSTDCRQLSHCHSCFKSFSCNTYRSPRKCWALLTSSLREMMPQAVNVVGQAEQQGLTDLGGQAAPGCARGELAFDGGEHAFDLVALPIRFFRKGAEHLIPNGTVRNPPASRRNNALRSQALPNVFVVGFRVKLRIREHHTDGRAARRPLPGSLRQQNLLPYIHHNQPLQPRTTRPGPVGMLLQAAVEEGADGSIGESGAVDGGRNGPAPASPQPMHGFLQSAIDGVILQPPQKTIQRGVVGHRWQ